MSNWEETPGQRRGCRDQVSLLVWEHLDVPQEEVEEVAGKREALHRLLPPETRIKGECMDF